MGYLSTRRDSIGKSHAAANKLRQLNFIEQGDQTIQKRFLLLNRAFPALHKLVPISTDSVIHTCG
jgi:hypothetical protein